MIHRLMRLLPPETAHRQTVALLAHSPAAIVRGLVGGTMRPAASLSQRLWGLDFAHPLGLAAGFDKDAQALPGCHALGFSFVEVGSITPQPQPGNERPRVFRLAEDRAVINRYGFNSQGLAAAERRLRQWRQQPSGLVGVNLGKNKLTEQAADDYVLGARALGPLADYLVINVSSPNTPGLRAEQAADRLAPLLSAVRRESDRPLLLKVAPDLTPVDIDGIVSASLACGIDGLIVSNTTLARPGLHSRAAAESGGLSGAPLMQPATAVLRAFAERLDGRLPLIGVGGVASAADAYAKLRAGAALVQLYTALLYQGPGLVRRIVAELPGLLARDGFTELSQAIGADLRA